MMTSIGSLRWMPIQLLLIAWFGFEISAAEPNTIPKVMAGAQSAKILLKKQLNSFFGPNSTALFFLDDTSEATDDNPSDVFGMVSPLQGNPVFLSKYPYEGGPAEITDAFVVELGSKGSKNLIVICKWRELHARLGIDGFAYKVYAYREKSKQGKGYLFAEANDSLEQIFGEGFDGVTEEGAVSTFKYKTPDSVISRLLGGSSPNQDPARACYEKIHGNYKSSASDLGCAIDLARIVSLNSSTITSSNAAIYNDLGFFLAERKKHKESALILEKVVAAAPTRTVAYLNLADAYWGLSDSVKSMPLYRKYCDRMKSEGKARKIPKRALERS